MSRLALRRVRWERLDDHAFLLRDSAEPRSVLCFVGGAVVGAAPQFSYDRFLRKLAACGHWILAVPYAAGLDYCAVADLLELRFARALSRLEDTLLRPKARGRPARRAKEEVPVWTLGHSLGALAQVLMSARHPARAAKLRGQILLCYTRRGEEVLPIARTALAVNPLLGTLLRSMDVEAASNFLAEGYKLVERAVPKGPPWSRDGGEGTEADSPVAMLRDVVPMVQQMLPLLRDVGAGRAGFAPSNSTLSAAVKEGYGVQNTLLIRLANDGLDETPGLAAALAALPPQRGVSFSVRLLDGQHLLPLLPDLGDAAVSAEGLLPRDLSSRLKLTGTWAETASGQQEIVDAIDWFIRTNS